MPMMRSGRVIAAIIVIIRKMRFDDEKRYHRGIEALCATGPQNVGFQRILLIVVEFSAASTACRQSLRDWFRSSYPDQDRHLPPSRLGEKEAAVVA
jgi:hypothetical protein